MALRIDQPSKGSAAARASWPGPIFDFVVFAIALIAYQMPSQIAPNYLILLALRRKDVRGTPNAPNLFQYAFKLQFLFVDQIVI
jgi:hypothetical protein